MKFVIQMRTIRLGGWVTIGGSFPTRADADRKMVEYMKVDSTSPRHPDPKHWRVVPAP